MSQIDRYKERAVSVDFQPNEEFIQIIDEHFYKLVLLTNGQLKGTLNGQPFNLSAPGMLCLAAADNLIIKDNKKSAAQSFAFKADFFNARALLPADKNIILTIKKHIRKFFNGFASSGRKFLLKVILYGCVGLNSISFK